MNKKKSRFRHLAKTITWRVIASLTTLVAVYIITGKLEIAGAILGIEVFLKMLFYYLHERAWFKYGRLGRDD